MSGKQNKIQLIIDKLNADPKCLNELFQFFADSILKANSISPFGWVVYEINEAIVLSIRNVYTISIGFDMSGRKINGIMIMAAQSALTDPVKKQLEELGCDIGDGFKNTGGSNSVNIPFGNTDNFTKALTIIRPAIDKYTSNVLKHGNKTSWSAKYTPELTQFLRDKLNMVIPDPEYFPTKVERPGKDGGNPTEIFNKIDNYLQSQGYYFTNNQITSFYTALQTKGFVILSGISGTGKTKLAQLFAQMLPVPIQRKIENLENVISITLQPDHLLRHRFIIPKKYIGYFEPIEPNKRVDISLMYQGKTQKCWMKSYEYPARPPYLMFWLQGDSIGWVSDNFKVGDTLMLQPDFQDEKLVGLTILSEQAEVVAEEEEGENCLFLSVRPDWRDSKSLLGYYNPLTKHYESTPFLEFLIKARNSFESGDGLAWFIILDEMNLARVEYYFADLLSVLESGRDDKGNTCETLRFIYGDLEEGEVPPPPKMALPPNLYIIGTVNVDETTQSFSPKVLDRAFSLEFMDVDFNRYTSPERRERPIWKRQEAGMELLTEFTRQKTFVQISKGEIFACVQAHPEFSEKLQDLNQKLQPFSMHFGYRVFDEIMMFLKISEDNKIEVESAFDQAILMKVLPKFHGSRGKLEKPLVAILVWCSKAKSEETEPIKTLLQLDHNTAINPDEWECPATAGRILRMLQSLNDTGFASFG
jgi:5-methylcytosine-specific restriction enzyme B